MDRVFSWKLEVLGRSGESSRGVRLVVEGGADGNSYEHHSIEEPAILLGGSFMVDVVESAQIFAGQKEQSG